jgi:hypothetical protein
MTKVPGPYQSARLVVMVIVKTNAFGSQTIVKTLLLHLRGVLIAVAALALSASLAFAAHAPAASLGADTGSTQAAGDEASGGSDEDVQVDENANEDVDGDEVDETTDEIADETADETTDATAGQDETVDAAGDNCLTDPTALTPEELAALNHGSIVCWAAHQTTWPEEFANHGAWVSSWAHTGKGTEAVNAKATTKTHKTKVPKP